MLEVTAYVVAGAVVALALLGLRPRAVTTGAGLVLLLLAAYRALAEAASAAGDPDGLGLLRGPLLLLVLAGGLAAGAGAGLLGRRRPVVREPLAVLAVALSALGLLAPLGALASLPAAPVDLHLVGDPGPSRLVAVLAGALAAGALPVLTRRLSAAGVLVAALALVTALGRHLDGSLLTAAAAAASVAVLVPLALEVVGEAVRAHGAPLGQGALVGVALVVLAGAVQALDERPSAGLPVRYGSYAPLTRSGWVPLTGMTMAQAYASTLDITVGPPPRLVPRLVLAGSRTVRIAG